MSPVPANQAQGSSSEPPKTPFALWLDSMIPAFIPSDAEFARRVGVNQSYVHKWRRGRRPQVPALLKFAKATGTSVETLLAIAGYTGDSEAKPS